ncbi:hypothetical protein CTI12_AA509370 [Artemisia annua]|uniref:Uncharacterized protein n=1 Tax=Artemisia annua TaxID=35608 RepID=A0A2U1LBL0_ARTAN|nr:hypothetical protein CTI12_AA509370 [Artemisia annua]
MVLWEITLGTAYFLGLKRTYKLALKIQRRLVGPKHPKIRHFLQRKTRSIFDVALKVHREVQQRDIEVGRSLGNWILRWLDKMKPSAHIRVAKPKPHDDAVNPTKQQLTDTSHQKPPKRYGISSKDKESGKRLFTSGTAIMTRPMQPFGIYTHNRHFNTFELKDTRFGVVRNDIMQWMIQN